MQAAVSKAKGKSTALRAVKTSLERQNETLSLEVQALSKANRDKFEEIKTASKVLKDSLTSGVHVTSKFVEGAAIPELELGDKTYKDIVVKQFDGKFLSFSHSNGAGKVEIPEAWQVKKEFESLGALNGVSLSSLVIKPYQPLPDVPKKKTAAKPRSRPVVHNYVAKNPINPNWPLWFRPSGWNYSGSAMSPLKQGGRTHCQ